jgi:3-hydroxybutyryl-CoA dehydrogenase
VLATNTSSLSVTEVAAGCAQPQRVAGLHFFNPPPLMKLVEVIGGLRTEPGVVKSLVEFARRIGKHPIVAADSPGFVVNHAGRAYGPEALRIVAQGIASPQEVDALMKEAAGFRMGPFELLDLVGGDVTHAVMVSIFEQFFDEPMYQPSAQMAVRVAGGLLGRKSKQGFYNYDGAPAKDKPTVPVAPGARPAAAWVASEDGGAELAEWLKGAGVKVQFGGTPAAGIPCFVAPLGEDASCAAVRLQLDPARTVAVDMFGRFSGRRTLMKTPLTKSDILAAAVAALSTEKIPVTVINDSPGFVVQRLLAMIVNIGTRIAELRIATPADIDTAVEFGLIRKGRSLLEMCSAPGASSPCSTECRPLRMTRSIALPLGCVDAHGSECRSIRRIEAIKKRVNSFICKWKTAFRAAQAGYDQGHAESPNRHGPSPTSAVFAQA